MGRKLAVKVDLTGHAIHTIQLYYGLAIRRNCSGKQISHVEEYFHLGSTYENPEHRLCHSDSDTWCKYQKEKLENTVYRHSEHTHLPVVVLEEIMPIFKHLSNTLLANCAHGGTEKISESLSHVIGCRIPKGCVCQAKHLEARCFTAISSNNKGNVNV